MSLSEVIRAAIELGRRDGFVTFDQLNEWLPPGTIKPEDIETFMQMLSDEGIDIRDQ